MENPSSWFTFDADDPSYKILLERIRGGRSSGRREARMGAEGQAKARRSDVVFFMMNQKVFIGIELFIVCIRLSA